MAHADGLSFVSKAMGKSKARGRRWARHACSLFLMIEISSLITQPPAHRLWGLPFFSGCQSWDNPSFPHDHDHDHVVENPVPWEKGSPSTPQGVQIQDLDAMRLVSEGVLGVGVSGVWCLVAGRPAFPLWLVAFLIATLREHVGAAPSPSVDEPSFFRDRPLWMASLSAIL